MDPYKFIEAVKENNVDTTDVSALLTTTMVGMKNVVELGREAGIKARAMIGGASITAEYAEEIGTDGYAPDAPASAREAKKLVEHNGTPSPGDGQEAPEGARSGSS